MKRIITVILSDIHLMSYTSRMYNTITIVRKILGEYINDTIFQNDNIRIRIILNGDIFEHSNIADLNNNELKWLEYMINLSTKENVEVIWIYGDHDKIIKYIVNGNLLIKFLERFDFLKRFLISNRCKKNKIIDEVLKLKRLRKYKWSWQGVKYLVRHGNKYDKYYNRKIYIRFLDSIYTPLKKFFMQVGWHFSIWVKESDMYRRHAEKHGYLALKDAKRERAKYIFTGHLHKHWQIERNGRIFINGGCLSEPPFTYIVIDDNGPKIYEYESISNSIKIANL